MYKCKHTDTAAINGERETGQNVNSSHNLNLNYFTIFQFNTSIGMDPADIERFKQLIHTYSHFLYYSTFELNAYNCANMKPIAVTVTNKQKSLVIHNYTLKMSKMARTNFNYFYRLMSHRNTRFVVVLLLNCQLHTIANAPDFCLQFFFIRLKWTLLVYKLRRYYFNLNAKCARN